MAAVGQGRLRVAVVGAGYFARFHYDGWARHGAVALAGACDLDAEKLKLVGAEFGIDALFADAGEMLDRVKPDLLDIATPPETHGPLVELAAARGIDVVCQKPLAPTFQEAEAIVSMAERAGIRLIVHENFRFQPWYRKIRALLDEGFPGTIHGISFRLRPGDGQGADAYLARQPYFQKMERFLIHETAIHLVDVFRYLCGEVAHVYARLRRLNPAIAGEDAGIVLFEFENGAQGVFDGNRLVDHASDNPRRTMGEMLLEGSAGTLRLDGMGRIWWKPLGEPEREIAYDWTDRNFGGDCVAAFQAHVVAHLLDGGPVENTGRDYLDNLRIEEAIYLSAAEGRRVAP